MNTEVYEHARNQERTWLLALSRKARAAENFQIALNSVIEARQLDIEEFRKCSLEVAEEYARVLWAKAEHRTAIEAMQTVLADPGFGLASEASQALLLASLVGQNLSMSCDC